MRSLYARYADLVRPPGMARFLALGFLARLPIGTVGLSTLLHVRDLTGSIAFAGSVVGAQLVATAAAAPVVGRLIDIRGPRLVLALTSVVPAVAILFTLFAGPLELSHAAILLAAIVTGAFMPPITTLVRAIWRHRYDDEGARRTAFALDSVFIELAFTVGPALIALLVALVSAQAALAFAWVCTAAAVPLLLASRGLRWWKSTAAEERHLLGPLREGRLVTVYGATFALTTSFGALEVGYPGFATALASPAWGPALIAINSIGSALGGLAYGGLHLSTPIERLLPRLLLLFAAPLALHLWAADPWTMTPLAFAAGILIAPSMTSLTLLVSRHAPPQYATEAFTWSSTAIVTGIGAGMAVGGALVERYGPRGAFLLAVASALVAALCAFLRRR